MSPAPEEATADSTSVPTTSRTAGCVAWRAMLVVVGLLVADASEMQRCKGVRLVGSTEARLPPSSAEDAGSTPLMHPRARARPKFGDVSAGWGGGGDVKQVMACGFWCAAARRCGRYDGPCSCCLLDPIRRDATRDAAAGPDHRLLSFCTSQTSQRSPWPLVLFGRIGLQMRCPCSACRCCSHGFESRRTSCRQTSHQLIRCLPAQSDHGELRFQA